MKSKKESRKRRNNDIKMLRYLQIDLGASYDHHFASFWGKWDLCRDIAIPISGY